MSVIPEKIGRYYICEEIGRGSMGTVFSATDPFRNIKIAIKVAHPRFTNDKDEGDKFKKLFFNEAHAAGLLNHPNILKIYDADIDNEKCYLVMEYLEDANTLEKYCKPEDLLPINEIVKIIYKCAKALDYAHRQGIIHRDIKPSNILETKEKNLKLADFSIAMITNKDNPEIIQFTGFLGSPLYMSPEQINEWEITPVSDIFSLGVVMYQMLTGHNPFRADDLTAICNNITNNKHKPLTTFREDIPEGLGYVIDRMLKKKPDKRYKNGFDLAIDLATIFEELGMIEDEDTPKSMFEQLEKLTFFENFSDADIWELIRSSSLQNFSVGENIITEDDSDKSVYILVSGLVYVHKQGRILGHLQEGDCFGEMGYFAKIKRTASVTAKTDVTVLMVNSESIASANMETQMKFFEKFLSNVILRLSDVTDKLVRTQGKN